MKKILSLMLCLFMLIGSLGITAYADGEYEIIEARKAISDYLPDAAPAELNIPGAIDGVDIISILDSSFDSNEALETLILPEGMLVISNKNFKKAPLLKNITLPESLQVIGDDVFSSCASLTEITIPSHISLIGSYALSNNEALAKVTFTGVAPLYVADGVFNSCSADLVIFVPDDQIDAYTAVLPEGLNIQSSGANAVVYDFTTPEDQFAFDAATGTITGYTGKTPRVEIPAAIGGVPVTAIGASAFEQNVYAYCVVLPEGLTAIGEKAFDAMSYNDYVYVPDTVTHIGRRAFAGYQGTDLHFPGQLATMDEKAFTNAVFDSAIVLPDGLTVLPVSAFEGSRFTGITLPEMLISIGDMALYKCKYYTELTIPASVTSIGSKAFAESDRLEKVIILCDPSIIPADAFDSCKKLKEIIVPDGTDAAVIEALSATGATVTTVGGAEASTSETVAELGNAEAFVGTWKEGENYVLTLYADGTGEYSSFGGEAVQKQWVPIETGIQFTDTAWNGLTAYIQEDGCLNINDSWYIMEKEGVEVTAPVEETVEAPAASVEGSVAGVWTAVSAESDGETLDKSMLEMFGLLITLNLNEDGTGTLAMEGEAGDITWTEDAGVVSIFVEGDSTTLNVNADGTISGDFGGVIIAFAKSEGEAIVGGEASVETPADVDTSALIGTWFDGDTTNFTINEDGTCVATDQYGDSYMDWEVVDGVPMITTGFWCDSPMILNADGTLYVSDGWSVEKTFTYGEGEIRIGSTLAEPTGTVAASSAEEFFGEWKGETMVMESGTFALADMMMVMDLTISADGTVALFDGAITDSAAWTYADGYMTAADGMIELSLMDNGQLCMAQEFNILYLSRAESGEAPVETPVEAPVETPVDAPAAAAEAFVGTWVSEYYKLELYEDGTGKYFYPDGTYDDKVWVVKGEGIEFTDLWWSGSTAVIEADGSLNVDNGWYVFQPENGSTAAPDTATAPAEGEGTVAVAAEMEDFVGRWIGTFMEMEGQTYALSDFGMIMEIALDINGNVSLYDGETTETGRWSLVDGKADIDGMLLTLMSDGTIVAEDPDGAKVVFTGFVGTWKACYLSTGGLTGDLRSMGITSTLVLNADGTGSIDFPTPEEGSWYREEGILRFGETGMPIEILSGGFLKYGSDLGGYIVFSQDETAVWDPSMAAPVEPAATEVPVIPAATEAPAAPANNGNTDMQALMNRKFVVKTYSSFGQTMDAAMLGAEYSVLFREDGTCDFGIAGMVVPNLPWGLQKVATGLTEVDAFVINYYGTMFNAVITDTGFDMDYYGTMTLHFEPAE